MGDGSKPLICPNVVFHSNPTVIPLIYGYSHPTSYFLLAMFSIGMVLHIHKSQLSWIILVFTNGFLLRFITGPWQSKTPELPGGV